MTPLPSGGRAPGRPGSARAVAWLATPRQRLRVYAVLAAIAGLACTGIDYGVDANRMNCVIKTPSQQACTQAATARECRQAPTWASDSQYCTLTECDLPCANPSTPVTNCRYSNVFTVEGCESLATSSKCTSFWFTTEDLEVGCIGYNCRELECP